MTWWPVAAMTAASVFVVSMGALLAAPAAMPLCGRDDAGIGTAVACDALLSFLRGLVVLSGAALAAALVAGLHAALAGRVVRGREDTRPLVSVHPRRR